MNVVTRLRRTITPESFQAAIESDETKALVDGVIMNACKKFRPPQRPVDVPVGLIERPLPFGTVHIIETARAAGRTPRNRHFGIATSVDFPAWLLGQGWRREEALMAASVYVDSYRLVVAAMRSCYQRMPSSHPMEPAYWPEPYREGGLAMPYRIASRIALEATAQDPLEIKPQPYPPHIAGLTDPFLAHELQRLNSVLQ